MLKTCNGSVTKIALQTGRKQQLCYQHSFSTAYNLQRSQEMPTKRLLVGIIALLLLWWLV